MLIALVVALVVLVLVVVVIVLVVRAVSSTERSRLAGRGPSPCSSSARGYCRLGTVPPSAVTVIWSTRNGRFLQMIAAAWSCSARASSGLGSASKVRVAVPPS